jgi:hypothetical protein
MYLENREEKSKSLTINNSLENNVLALLNFIVYKAKILS